KPGGEVSYSGESGALSYTASLSSTADFGRNNRVDLFYIPGEPPYERQEEDQRFHFREYAGAATLTYILGDADILNLNARYAFKQQPETEPSNRYMLRPTGESFTARIYSARTFD